MTHDTLLLLLLPTSLACCTSTASSSNKTRHSTGQRCCMLLHRHTCHHIPHLGVQYLSKYNDTGRQPGTRQCTGYAKGKGSKNVITAKNSMINNRSLLFQADPLLPPQEIVSKGKIRVGSTTPLRLLCAHLVLIGSCFLCL